MGEFWTPERLHTEQCIDPECGEVHVCEWLRSASEVCFAPATRYSDYDGWTCVTHVSESA